MPASDTEALARHMLVSDARNLEDYLARFDVTLSVMQTAEALERIAYELVEDAARDGVRYIEIRYAPVLNVRGGLSLGEAVEAPLRGIERAERDHGTRGRVIICGLRNMAPEVSLELARLAVAYARRGVVGFDLAGGELGHPASVHAAAFEYARRHDLAVTVHAGEGAGAESVRQAVQDCRADRIGHATRLWEDAALAQYVNDRRIALEICLTSNVQTHAARSYEAHPLRGYFDRGMNVVLNTDNRLMSGTTLTDEYLLAARHLDFSLRELGEVALNGFASAFLPWEERRVMLEEARREIDALTLCR
jgi:adenosine deaminase